MLNEIKISLNENDFNCLVRGGELTIETKNGTVKMILQDIGFSVMRELIDEHEIDDVEHFMPFSRIELC